MWLIIFELYDAYTLSQVNVVRKQFHRASQEILIKKTSNLSIVNQVSDKFRQRCNSLLSPVTKLITFYNWNHELCGNTKIHRHGNATYCTKCVQYKIKF